MNALASAHFWLGAAAGSVVTMIAIYGLLLVSEAEARIELMERRPIPYSPEREPIAADEYDEEIVEGVAV